MAQQMNAFLEALRSSQLLGPGQWQKIQRRKALFGKEPFVLARWLLEKGWLTPFQVNWLLQGRTALTRGRYRLLDYLGDGSDGRAFVAGVSESNRVVALKTIPAQNLARADAERSFQRDGRLAVQLRHPHLVQVHEIGQANGSFCVVTEYVIGLDLKRWVQKFGPMPVDLASELMGQAALALQHAHERGLPHGAIRPSRLMVAYGDRRDRDKPAFSPAAGSAFVKILDPGVARWLETPMVAMDSHASAGVRADLYSLGCTFYFLLTGRFPAQVRRLRQTDELPGPEKFRPDLPAPLAATVRRLLARRSEERFQTAAELAEALLPFEVVGEAEGLALALAEEPLPNPIAHAPLVSEEAIPWVLAGDPLESPVAPVQAEVELLPLALPVDAAAAALPATAIAEAALVRSVPKPPVKPSRPRVFPAVEAARLPAARSSQRAQTRCSKNSWVVAAAIMLMVTVGLAMGGMFLFWPSPSADEPAARQETAALPTGSELAQAPPGEPPNPEPAPEPPKPPPENPQPQPAPPLQKPLPEPPPQKPPADPPPPNPMPQRPEGALPVAGGLHAFRGHGSAVTGLAFSPDGRFALSAGLDGTIRLWDVTAHKYLRTFAERTNGVRSVVFTPDGRFALSGHDDKLLRLWDVQTGGLVRRFQGHTQTVNKVAISPDGELALSGGFDDSVRLWDVGTGQELHVFSAHTQMVMAVLFSPDGRFGLSASTDGSARIYDLVEKKQLREIPRQDKIRAIYQASFSDNGRLVLVYGAMNVVWVGETATGKQVRDFACKTRCSPRGMAFAPDGRKGLSQDSKSNDLWLWSTETGRQLGCFTGLGHEITSLVISPDGNHALAGCINGTVYMWSLVPPAAAKK